LSPQYRDQSARLEAANRDVEHAQWNRQQTGWEMEAALHRIDEHRERMTWWQTVKNVWRQDPELTHWRDLHERSIGGYKHTLNKEYSLEKEQARATRDANRAYDRIKPAAGEELVKRLERQAAAEEEKRIRAAIERSGAVQSRDLTPEQDRAQDQQMQDRFGVETSAAEKLRAEQAALVAKREFADLARERDRVERKIAQGAKGPVEALKRLHDDARLDITGYQPSTVEDVARELSPAFAAADDRAKALRQAQVNLNNLIDATDNSRHFVQRQHEQRQRQMNGLQKALDRYGPLGDRQLSEFEERMDQLSAEREALIMRAPALGHDLSAAEYTRAVELEKVRKPAERELADRQQRATAARAELAAERAREVARERAQWEAAREAERQRERQAEREGHVHRHSRGMSLGR
jgi:hypothetical protein